MASGPSKDSRPASPPERLTLRFSTSFWGKSPFSSPDNIEPNTKSDHKSPQSASQRLTYLIFYDTKWDFLSRSLASTKPDPAQILVSLSSTVRSHSFSSQPEVSWEKISALKAPSFSRSSLMPSVAKGGTVWKALCHHWACWLAVCFWTKTMEFYSKRHSLKQIPTPSFYPKQDLLVWICSFQILSQSQLDHLGIVL